MLRALLHDLAAVEGVETVVMRDSRLSALAHAGRVHIVHTPAESHLMFEACLAACDAVWPIAPESGGTLESLARRIADSRTRHLGSSIEAIQVASSKIETSRVLLRAGIAAIRTERSVARLEGYRGPVVVKPDDGAGCRQTYFFEAPDIAGAWLEAHPEFINCAIQPYLPGEALSLSLICQSGCARVLSCNRQRVAVREGLFCFDGTQTGAGGDGRAYQALADAVAHALPGLWGYVGVDFIASADGPVVMEINPRLTSSYVSLAEVSGINPARLVLGLVDAVRFGDPEVGYAHA